MSADHRDLLDKALRSARSKLLVTPEIRTAIKEICVSRERLVHEHEDSLIAFKLAIVDSATAAEIPPSPERNDLLAKLVTIYVEEFYSPSAPSPEGSGRTGAQRFAPDS